MFDLREVTGGSGGGDSTYKIEENEKTVLLDDVMTKMM